MDCYHLETRKVGVVSHILSQPKCHPIDVPFHWLLDSERVNPTELSFVTSRKGRPFSFYQQFCSVSAGRAICHRRPRAKIMLKKHVRKPLNVSFKLVFDVCLVKYIVTTIIIVVIYIYILFSDTSQNDV